MKRGVLTKTVVGYLAEFDRGPLIAAEQEKPLKPHAMDYDGVKKSFPSSMVYRWFYKWVKSAAVPQTKGLGQFPLTTPLRDLAMKKRSLDNSHAQLDVCELVNSRLSG